MENEEKIETVEAEEIDGEEVADRPTEDLEATEVEEEAKGKFSFPILGVVIIASLVVIVVTLIILLYAFGGPLPAPEK